ncbi:MAG: hypothetical protein WCW13_03110 [archaeon]|jgi:hypothetical protein
MSYLCKRIVKQKKYYYLEEAFHYKDKLTKESVYLGSLSPSNDELFLAEEMLKRKCLAKEHVVLVPPLTEFIKNRTASIIEISKNARAKKLAKLSGKRKKDLKKKERELFFKPLTKLRLNEEIPTLKNFQSCFRYYDLELKKNEPITETKIHKMYSLLNGNTNAQISEESKNILHALSVWYKEKDDLIHPVEFAAKFHSKFLNLKPFEKYGTTLALLLMNYILEQKGFGFVNISSKRKSAYEKAIVAGAKEDFNLFTKFLIKEVIK